MIDNTMIYIDNFGISIGNDLNSGTGYTPGKGEVTREPKHVGSCQRAVERAHRGVRCPSAGQRGLGSLLHRQLWDRFGANGLCIRLHHYRSLLDALSMGLIQKKVSLSSWFVEEHSCQSGYHLRKYCPDFMSSDLDKLGVDKEIVAELFAYSDKRSAEVNSTWNGTAVINYWTPGFLMREMIEILT